MPIKFITQKPDNSRPILLAHNGKLPSLSAEHKNWVKAHDFKGEKGKCLFLPTHNSDLFGAILGVDENPFSYGDLGRILPAGCWHFEEELPLNAFLAIAMGAYAFHKSGKEALSFVLSKKVEIQELQRLTDATQMVRDLINQPANIMTPEKLEQAVHDAGNLYHADVSSIVGDDLIKQNFPLIHAVGRASSTAPRLIELNWGEKKHPLITLVGKGVCFDSGGLDIKSASGMLLMKKDMGGAANVLGLARLIMDAKLPFRLQLIIPAVDNAISGNSFRPSDIIESRKGLSVEIGNTDAEGRLVLADALAYGDEQAPQLMLDMATLTGAARIALGPDLPPFYTQDEAFAQKIIIAANAAYDPLWRMPLWQPYMKNLSSRVADINNVTSDNFAGSLTAALFLSRFVEKAKTWAHFDIYGWTPSAKPGFPIGGEAQGIRALYDVLKGGIR